MIIGRKTAIYAQLMHVRIEFTGTTTTQERRMPWLKKYVEKVRGLSFRHISSDV